MKLFGSKKEEIIAVQNLTIIGNETVLEGSLLASGDVRIDGKICGNVETNYRLVVGEKGVVLGNISAKSSEIAGEVVGNIRIAETLSLTKSAKINGDIEANKLVVEIDAAIEGKCQIGAVEIDS